MIRAGIHDDRRCELGEGPFWHPERKQLFWFDITAGKLLSQDDGEPLQWTFGECVSAAGWIDRDTLLMASETGLYRFDIPSGRRDFVVALEAEKAATRSNDGRADPFGGFWIGTMGKSMQSRAGAIYRYYRGECRKLFGDITVPNSLCFAPDGGCAYLTDTPTQRILRQPLDGEGWPDGPPALFADLGADRLFPDGSVIDAEGCLWNAQWGAARVARYRPDGRFDTAVEVGGRHSSCPAFGGRDLDTLFVTTACEGIEAPDDAQGRLYSARPGMTGLPEARVIL